ncbi:MAG: hypothetical protein IJR29_13260 [Butyrivibrio sp.]|nr:hypothetical protein [Butyrivibrio sp.]
MKSEKKKIFDVMIILVLALLLAIRLRYGFDQTDESHYYALAKRFCQGDIPFIDEWHPSQFFAILLCPFYYVYSVMVPGAEGVILAGRYTYLVIQVVTCLFILWSFRSKKYNLLLSIIYFMCARQNIPGLSYYNLFMTFCVVAVVAILDYLSAERKNSFFVVVAGVSISAATVCMPFLAIGVAVLLIFLLIKKEYKILLPFTGSIFVCASLYVFFLLSRASFSDYFEAQKYVMSSPDHMALVSTDKVLGTIFSIGKVCILGIPGFVYLMTRFFYVIKVKKQEGNTAVFFDNRDKMIYLLTLLLCVISFGINKPGAIYIQITVLSFPYVLNKCVFFRRTNNGDERKGIILYFVGIVMAFLFWLGSNTEASCLLLGLIISVFAVVILMFEEFCFEKNKLLLFSISITVAVVFVRIMGPCYRDARLWELDTIICEGPAKGIYTEEEDAKNYYEVLEMISFIENSCTQLETKVLFTRFLPWGYLVCNLRNGSMTTWETPICGKRLIQYYNVNTSKFPDVVIILDSKIGSAYGYNSGGMMNAYNDLDGEIWDKIKNCYVYESGAGTVYYTRRLKKT